MHKNRIVNFTFSLMLLTSLFFGGGGAVRAQQAPPPPDGGNPPYLKHGPITEDDREAAAARRAAQMQAAGVSTRKPSKAPVPGGVPDYFGPFPNWANSPRPVVDPISGKITGGIRKFVDTLPGLTAAGANDLGQYIPLGVKDTTTYSGTDYYEIGLVEYTEQMHKDLPPTRLRGYVQLSTAVVPGAHIALNYLDAAGNPTLPIRNTQGQPVFAVDKPSYLGPTIVASQDRPVRVKFTNYLPAGSGGNLYIPTDTSAMGAGTGPLDALGNPCDSMVRPDCAVYSQDRATLHLHGGTTPWISDGTPHQWTTPAGENTQYPKGVSVQYVPDMWYDPVTHVTVPAGTAGATNNPGPGSLTFYYTNQQSARLMFYHDHAYGITRLNVYAGEAAGYVLTDPVEGALAASGVISDPVYGGVGIPLVFQDKTFVPDAATLALEDPTWDTARFGGLGNFWFPHVYMPNQNPWDISGANAMGRWDLAQWFWPPTLNIAHDVIPNPYYDPVNAPWEPPFIPGTPNPSLTPESFMDTPLVNGTAYPVLNVLPKAYRFRILNAANDRMMNLSLWQAASDAPMWNADGSLNDANAGEVPMVPAQPNPNIPFPPSWTVAGGGPGIRPDILDGRTGGVPDPRAAGPSWVQIGTEGGFLPNTVTLPPSPTGYEYNLRNIVVTNVTLHSLFIAPAERADVIVDFSKFAGKTLIVYNDAPAPVPAGDPRIDYYTGNPDMTDTGGAPSTLPGYGPNTRTMMQIKVGTVGGAAGSPLASLSLTNGGSHYSAPTVTIAPPVSGTVATAQATGSVEFTILTSLGTGYSSAPTVTITDTAPGIGSGATAAATVSVSGLTLTAPGSGYTGAPSVIITDTAPGTGSGATARATLAVTGITFTAGSGYTSTPTVTIADTLPFTGTGATAAATLAFSSLGVGSGGSGYSAAPFVAIGDATTGVLATGNATVAVTGISFTAGSGYTSTPTVTITDLGGTPTITATATATVTAGAITAITVNTVGHGYTTPHVTITGGGGSGANATTTGPVDSLTLTAAGHGYTAPTVNLVGDGTGAIATFSCFVENVHIVTNGANYGAPVVTFTGGGGTGATATVTGAVDGLTLVTPGAHYSLPVVSFPSATGSGASATTGGAFDGLVRLTTGDNYSAPVIQFSGGGGTGAAGEATLNITHVTLVNPGSGYTSLPAVTIADTFPGVGHAATAVAVLPLGPAYNQAAIDAALPAAYAQVQPMPIITQPGYNAAFGANFPADTYARIQDASMTFQSTSVTSLTLTSGGVGYTSVPTVTIVGGNPTTPATAVAEIAGGTIAGAIVTSGGLGYTSAPTVTITGGGGTGATGTALVSNGVLAVTVGNGGSGYTGATAVTFTSASGTGAAATATIAQKVGSVTVVNKGSGYTSAPTVTFTGGGGSGVTGTAAISGIVSNVTLQNRGSGFASMPTVTFTGGAGTGAAATATGAVLGVGVSNYGSGYTTAPTVTFTGGGGSGAAAIARGFVNPIAVTNGGSGYTTAPTVTFTGGGGSGAAATATVSGGLVTAVNLTSAGSGYSSSPTVGFSGGGGSGATASATISFSSIQMTLAGSGYTTAPAVTFTGGGGSGMIAVTNLRLNAITVSNSGSGYTSAPTVGFTGGGGSGATATASITNGVTSVTVTNGGTNYTSAPTVGFTGGGGSGATATAVLTGYIASVAVTNRGSGYTTPPAVGFTVGSGAVATATLTGVVNSILITNGGSGYTSAPTITITGGGGSGATAVPTFASAHVSKITLTSGGLNYKSAPTVVFSGGGGSGAAASASLTLTMEMENKAIQELFELDYGRMNATLGVEAPKQGPNFQTTLPLGYIDPPTEIVTATNGLTPMGSLADGTQIWKITHNGVDTHVIHWHMFDVQLINRVGWDGAIRPPEPNELGWKESVRMNQLEDAIVALRPIQPTLPWQVPDSIRPLDVTRPLGSTSGFFGIDPANNPITIVNRLVNFGYEFVWHCHILGHEENDMMRATIIAVAPVAPTNLVATALTGPNRIRLTWRDNSLNETGFIVQRALAQTGPWTTRATTAPLAGIGSTFTYFDSPVSGNTTYFYKVFAANLVGDTAVYPAPAVGYPSVSVNSAPTNGAFATIGGAAGTFIMANGFETGLAPWSGVAGNVVVAAQAAMGPNGGAVGMVANMTPPAGVAKPSGAVVPQQAYVYDLSPNHETNYQASFYFSPNDSKLGDSPVTIFTGLNENQLPTFGVQIRTNPSHADDYEIRGWAMQSGSPAYTGWVGISGDVSKIGLTWHSGANAAFWLLLDGRLVGSLTGNTSANKLTEVMLGPSSGLTTGSGSMYFDDFVSTQLPPLFSLFMPAVSH